MTIEIIHAIGDDIVFPICWLILIMFIVWMHNK